MRSHDRVCSNSKDRNGFQLGKITPKFRTQKQEDLHKRKPVYYQKSPPENNRRLTFVLRTPPSFHIEGPIWKEVVAAHRRKGREPDEWTS